MNLSELKSAYGQVRKGPNVNPFGLRKAEYRKHYPLIKDAVKDGLDLMTVIKILREKEGAFEDATDNAVWSAYNRALKNEGVKLKRGKSRKGKS
jgi:hypothetical protein